MFTICFTGHRNRVADPQMIAGVKDAYPNARWINGGAEGFDTQVTLCAKKLGIEVEVVRPNYDKYKATSKYAPIARNHEMVDRADMVVACWDGRVVGGTFDTIKYAISKHKLIMVLPPLEVSYIYNLGRQSPLPEYPLPNL